MNYIALTGMTMYFIIIIGYLKVFQIIYEAGIIIDTWALFVTVMLSIFPSYLALLRMMYYAKRFTEKEEELKSLEEWKTRVGV